jgi:hypothetical protein
VPLKSAFNWLMQRFGAQPPPPDRVTVSSTVHAKTSDDVFVLIPIKADLKVVEQRGRVLGIDPLDQARTVIDMAMSAEVAGITYADLLKPPDGFSDQMIRSCGKAVLETSGLDLLGLHIKKALGPAMLAVLTQEIEKAHAAAREQAKAMTEAHTSAQGLMNGLDNEIQVKKPLSLKKASQQP